MFGKVLRVVLALVLVCSLNPLAAWADPAVSSDATPASEGSSPTTYTISSVAYRVNGQITYIAHAGDQITAFAKYKDASNRSVEIPDRDLRVEWQISDTSRGTYTTIAMREQNAPFEVPAEAVGKFLRAMVFEPGGTSRTSSRGVSIPAPEIVPTLTRATIDPDSAPGQGQTLTAHAWAENQDVSGSKSVSFQWYSAERADGELSPIAGATRATFTTTSSQAGRYLAVRASAGESTQTSSIVGPVAPWRAYDITKVVLETSGVASEVGATLTPKAKTMVQGMHSSYEGDIPDDAQVAYRWQVAEDERGTNARDLTDADGVVISSTGAITLSSDDLAGSYIRAVGNAHGAEGHSSWEPILARNTYQLSIVRLDPQEGSLVAGDTLRATVRALSLTSTLNKPEVTDREGVSITWSYAQTSDAPESSWTPFVTSDARTPQEGKSFSVPHEAIGSYVRVTATSGTYRVSEVFPNPVLDPQSPDALVAKLTQDGFNGWVPNPEYGVDTNVNSLARARLAELGYDVSDVTVSVSDVSFSRTNDNATVGIVTDAEQNGLITYYQGDPTVVGRYAATSLSTVNHIVFTITKNGKSASYTPKRTFRIPWNEDAARSLLAEKAKNLAISFAEGDSTLSFTQTAVLPNKVANESWTNVTWYSPSESIEIKRPGFSVYNAIPTRGLITKQTILTARVNGLENYGFPGNISVDLTFPVTIPGDPDQIARENATLQQKIDAAWTPESLSYISSSQAVRAESVVDDLQFPTTRKLKVDGKQYRIEYRASNNGVEINGYRGNVYRPLPTEDRRSVDLTLTVTDKSNPLVSATKTITVSLEPLDVQDIKAEQELMRKAQEEFAQALTGSSDSVSVTENLRTFKKATRSDQDGGIAWSYTLAEANAAGSGIVPVELDSYDPMGSATQARLFQSSNPSVIAHETLQVTRPESSAHVLVSALLSSERYARYAERFPDNDLFAGLSRQSAQARLIVVGTVDTTVHNHVTASVVGIDAFGEPQVWASPTGFDVEEGTTVATVTSRLFEQAHLTADTPTTAYGYFVNTITSPITGKPLGWDSATGKYWRLIVNGKPATQGASQIVLHEGDSIKWVYASDSEDAAQQATQQVTVAVFGPDAQGNQVAWAPRALYASREGMNAADATEAYLTKSGLEHTSQMGSYGYYLSSITSPFTGESLAYSEQTGKYWQLFINGKSSNVGAGSYTLRAGDVIEWVYSSYGQTPPSNDIVTDPHATGDPSLTAWWPSFEHASGVFAAASPTKAADATWSVALKQPDDYATYVSDPLLVGDIALIAVGQRLQMRNTQTGDVVTEVSLASSIDSIARMVFDRGIVYVPLHGGRVQAIAVYPRELMTKWVSDPVAITSTLSGATLGDASAGSGQPAGPISPLAPNAIMRASSQSGITSTLQSLSNISVSHGCVYLGATQATWQGSTGGVLVCLDAATGALRWINPETQAGYYWTGSVDIGTTQVVVTDAGVLRRIDPQNGAVVQALDLGHALRSVPVFDQQEGYLYLSTYDGYLLRVRVGLDGDLSIDRSVRFAASSTSTPALVAGKLYVGGSAASTHSTEYGSVPDGQLSIIDAKTLTVERRISTTEQDGVLPGDVKATPLVVQVGGNTMVYFTSNANPGGLYAYRVGDTAARLLYVPHAHQQNFSLSSPVVAQDGSLYYVNDAGVLFKLIEKPNEILEPPFPLFPSVIHKPNIHEHEGEDDGEPISDVPSDKKADHVLLEKLSSQGVSRIQQLPALQPTGSAVPNTSSSQEQTTPYTQSAQDSAAPEDVPVLPIPPAFPWILVVGIVLGTAGLYAVGRRNHER